MQKSIKAAAVQFTIAFGDTEANLSYVKAALRRLALIDEMAGMGQRDNDPELKARCAHAAGTLETIERLMAGDPR